MAPEAAATGRGALAGWRFQMSRSAIPRYDAVIVGAGPVGSVCALAHARKGARVALLEASARASRRLAGEWLHPPAVQMLRSVGIRLDARFGSRGLGFVVIAEDGLEPIELPYPDGSSGLVCDHAALVSRLHEAVGNEPDIDFFLGARVSEVEDGGVAYVRNGSRERLVAARVVGADGRASVVRRSLGLPIRLMTCSRMVGITLEGTRLERKGFGHVLLGGPGPMLAYQLAEHRVRIVADVPLELWTPRERIGLLADSYAGLLPETLRAAFVEALRAGKFHAAANAMRPRLTYGHPDRVLIGDAAGHYHPLTAVGMTLGFGDALALAEGTDFRNFTHKRFRATRAPELLAMGLHEVFYDHRREAVALRHAVYRNWRAFPAVRDRTVRMLACEDTSVAHLGLSLLATVVRAVAGAVPRSLDRPALGRARDIVVPLIVRIGWFLLGIHKVKKAKRKDGGNDRQARDTLARAFPASMPSPATAPPPIRPREAQPPDAGPALKSAVQRLLNLQRGDGAWEGEMVWCPMLAAQYALLHHIMGRALDPDRRRLLLRNFDRTRLDGGLWGLHAHSQPYLFVTTLVYVASRLLGTERDDPLIEPARRFLQAEGVTGIPSWGKFWLALLNLYDWRGVNAILPELWRLPRWTAIHPSKWYCHTRLIYMAMAAIYPLRFQTPVTPLIASLREELFPQGFTNVDFAASRNRLRDADLYARPGAWLKAGYGIARVFDRFHGKRLRDRCMEELVRRIRWELRTTSHTSISPVSGLLNILALWLRDPRDPDCSQALAKLDDWIWEDEENGTRVTGVRTASWDTGFALQALAATPLDGSVQLALRNGAGYLRRQQIGASFEGFGEAWRTDPRGGWCVAGGWHGWPVTDCTAEAVLGIIAAGGDAMSTEALGAAIQFMLRGQNGDGGFGSYEASRSRVGLDWLNPAEMFGESMAERSYVECTASCLAALTACTGRFPQVTDASVGRAIARGEAWLRRTQASDGSWRGSWGVQFVYGTFFGIRGLVAAGAGPGDPALRLACRWLLERQLGDGGWGEHCSGCTTGRYVAHEESQVVQTAWALMALLEAGDSNWPAISRGARFLVNAQEDDGGWPRQDAAGVFFRTALLDYVLYWQYFPLHALGLYEQRRRARLDLTTRYALSPGRPAESGTPATTCGAGTIRRRGASTRWRQSRCPPYRKFMELPI